MRSHYTLENLSRAVRNPQLFLREGHRMLSLPVHHLYGRYLDRTLLDGSSVMDEDWDTLVILDACRYDYFEDRNWLNGDLESRTVGGNMSWEFMKNNFVGGEFHDTVYVTANPYATHLADGTFHHADYLIDEWDDDVGTIFPEDVREAALETAKEYPNKRLIIHFMQPHRPYLGPTADELRERVNLKGYRNQGDGLQIWGAVKEKKVTPTEVRRAYGESLDTVLKQLEALLKSLGGKTVVTADHGEMLGERVSPLTTRIWGHSEGFSTRLLRTVPWLTVEGGERREITAEDSVESRDLGEDAVSERLEALGYRE